MSAIQEARKIMHEQVNAPHGNLDELKLDADLLSRVTKEILDLDQLCLRSDFNGTIRLFGYPVRVD